MKKLISTFIFSTLALGNLSAVEPYDSVNLIAYEPYFLPSSWSVFTELVGREGKVFVDVNSPDNAASRYIAQNVDDSVKVYAISAWKGLRQFQQFLSNVIQEETTSRVIPIRMCSEEATSSLNVIADIIYLDTSNPKDLHHEILHWSPHLSLGGAILGDDWNYHEVESAVVSAASDLGFSVRVVGTLWILERN